MFEQLFRHRQRSAILDHEIQELYGRLDVLGANIAKLKQLGLEVPELELLLERLGQVRGKRLVRLITSLANHQPTTMESGVQSKSVIKSCPRCTRDLTDANIIKEHYSDHLANFILVCECGYLREMKNFTIKEASRQRSILEYS
jgi:hypothetical protein